MKRQMSLKWKLTLSVFIVLSLVSVVLGLFLRQLLASTDEKLFATLESRAEAYAKAMVNDVAFEVAALLKNDAQEKVQKFLQEHPQEAYAIFILLPDQKPFVSVGEEANIEQIISDLVAENSTMNKEGTTISGELVVANAPIKTEGEDKAAGYIIYTESLREYNAQQKRLIMLGSLSAVLGLLIIMFGAYWLGHRTATPLNKLVAAAQRIADGNLEHVEIEALGSMETKRLSASIQSMAQALQNQVIAIKAITKDVSGVSREVASAMTHLASSASQQAAAVTETASTVEEMEKAGKSAGGNAKQIVEAAEKTTEASIRGRNAVETTSEIILMIKDDSNDISEKSKNLLSSVEEVGNIIGSVNAIAEQSKILAVNASIEAAKAGEYGSGFAVVAQEVKDLAQQSKDATLQITDTLTAIRQAIENMVNTAQSGEERTDEGVRMIANAGAIMNDLADAIRENSDFANVIATNINQQTVGLTQIATAIEEINSTALENQDISRKIEHSTRSMTSSVDKLSELVGKWRTPEINPEDLTEIILGKVAEKSVS